MVDDEKRIAALKAKLRAREGRLGLAANVAELKAQIARVEARNVD